MLRPARNPGVPAGRTDRALRRAAGLLWRGPDPAELRAAVEGRLVLVTGASSGIGEATARRVAAAGATALLVARRADELERVRAEIVAAGGAAHVLPANLADEAAVGELVTRILDGHGVPDVVVNNAGHSIRRPVHHAYDRYHDYSRTIAINYLGPVGLVLGLLPGMRERGSGHLVNVGTVAVDLPAPYWSAYTASKSAFEVWLRCVGPEARADGVDWSSIHFGLVHTAMSAPTEALRNVPGMSAAEAADAVCRVLVERPRVLRPWWARLQAMGNEASPAITDRVLTRMVRFDHAVAAPAAPPVTQAGDVRGDRGDGVGPLYRHARERTGRRPWAIVLTLVAVLVLGVGATGALVWRHLQGNINSLDVSRGLGNDRPTAAPVTGDQGPQNILLIGTDTRAGTNAFVGGDEKDAGRSDTTILLHVAADRSSATGVSIPRDSMVDMPDCRTLTGGESAAGFRQFNDSYTIGGPACTLRTVEQLTGVRIDHYLVVDFTGFRDMVNALGSVEICLPQAVHDSRARLDLPAGRTRVNGDQALAYVRVRHGIGDGGDLGRVARQQAFLSAVLQQATGAGTLTNPKKLYDLLDTATRAITVDPGLASLTSLASLAREVHAIGLDNIRFLTVPTAAYPKDPNRLVWAPASEKVWQALAQDRPLVTTPKTTPTRPPTATSAPSGTPAATPSAPSASPAPPAVALTGVEARTADADVCT